MAQTVYTYTIADDTLNGAVHGGTLQAEIAASGVTVAVDYINTHDGFVDVYMKDALGAPDHAALTAVLGAHTGVDPDLPTPGPHNLPVYAPYAFGVSEEQTKFKSYMYSPSTDPAGAVSVFDELITKQVYLQGGSYHVKEATEGDNADFSIVDKDDVLGMFAALGLTVGVDVLEVRRYVETEYMFDGENKEELRVDAAGQLVQGLYFRCVYRSMAGAAQAPKLKVRYLYYEV